MLPKWCRNRARNQAQKIVDKACESGNSSRIQKAVREKQTLHTIYNIVKDEIEHLTGAMKR